MRLDCPARAPVAQGIERAPPEREVAGSIPAGRMTSAAPTASIAACLLRETTALGSHSGAARSCARAGASERDRHLAVHGHRGLYAPAARARRALRRRACTSTVACCATRSLATEGTRWTRRGTRSSSRSRARATRSPRQETPRPRWRTDPCACGSGIHTGEPVVTEEGYVGVDVHRAARIMGAGHGGQVLLSETTAGLLDSTAGAAGSRRAPAQGPDRAAAPVPARRRGLPATEDALPDEPAHPADAARRP